MRQIIHPVNDIIYNILKKQSPILAELIINWGKITGAQFNSHSQPVKITNSYDKGKKITILHIKATNSSVAMAMSFQQDIIIERIAVYFGYKAINKIRITI